MTDEWYVLIEEDSRETERVDGGELQLHRWMLVGTHYVDGGEEQATAAAEDAALHFIPRGLALHARPGDEPSRHAFLTQEGAWVVLIRLRDPRVPYTSDHSPAHAFPGGEGSPAENPQGEAPQRRADSPALPEAMDAGREILRVFAVTSVMP
ncbi:hypothetical protein AB0M86_22775 [Streptomyces sp. NPDC051639]|uniref:hypothetical protein n=1 Tax=Streptomyces sp. NPDC051639 TaxID=3155671 RepID=UPI003436165F